MSVRTNAIVLALATVAAPSFAQSVFVGGEQGWIDQPVQSRLTREQVTGEYLAFRQNPVAPDGGQIFDAATGGPLCWPKTVLNPTLPAPSEGERTPL